MQGHRGSCRIMQAHAGSCIHLIGDYREKQEHVIKGYPGECMLMQGILGTTWDYRGIKGTKRDSRGIKGTTGE